MPKPTLVIMAAGMGSRYGGMKQIDPVDEYGNLIIDYSIYDALHAGFERTVCIIKHEMEAEFQEVIGDRLSKRVGLTCAFQELDDLPAGFSLPEGRVKPWGTGHAVLCARGVVDGPFAVINADDYYGREAFTAIYQYLCTARAPGEYAMVGYEVQNTLTDHGAVVRGVCAADENGFLTGIREIRGIKKHRGGGAYEENGRLYELAPGTVVSMNLWGFDAGMLENLERGFPAFLEQGLKEAPLTCEYLLPTIVEDCLKAGKARVRILESGAQWFGVTYREDMPAARAAVRALKEKGQYPEKLWG